MMASSSLSVMLSLVVALLVVSPLAHAGFTTQSDLKLVGRANLEYVNKMMRIIRKTQDDIFGDADAKAAAKPAAGKAAADHPETFTEAGGPPTPPPRPDLPELPDIDYQEPVEWVPPFACVPEEADRVPEPPLSVHELRPTDIRVTAAFGDSVTAGVGMGDIHLVLDHFSNRGEAFSNGGDYSYDKKVLTIPNILRKFGNDVRGDGKCMAPVNSRHAWYNLARPDATSEELLLQTNMFLDRLFNDSQVDAYNDWKLLTILIGGSDICKSCHDTNGLYKPETYRLNVERALDRLYATVPRMLVNLVIQFPVSFFSQISDGLANDTACSYTQLEFCDCAIDPKWRGQLRDLQLAYYEQLNDLVNTGKYDARSDFAVVIQPHMRDMENAPINATTGEPDRSYFAYHCIHFSRKGQMSLAYMLWNTMMTPVGHKPFVYDFNEEPKQLRCSTAQHKFIFTRKNSNVQWP